MPKQVGPVASNADVDINITGLSPHVVAYTLWSRGPNDDDWTMIAEGATGDNQPDHVTTQLAARWQIWYWFGIGNPAKPNIPYNVLLTLGQGGQRLPGGTILLEGRTDGSGNDVVEDWIDIV